MQKIATTRITVFLFSYAMPIALLTHDPILLKNSTFVPTPISQHRRASQRSHRLLFFSCFRSGTLLCSLSRAHFFYRLIHVFDALCLKLISFKFLRIRFRLLLRQFNSDDSSVRNCSYPVMYECAS